LHIILYTAESVVDTKIIVFVN